MRRKECEVTDSRQIREFLASCEICRIAFCDQGQPYLVPLSFGMAFDEQGRLQTLYFHGAREGRKIDCLKANPQVCFEMDGKAQVKPGQVTCAFSMRYQSVIGQGTARFLEDAQEKCAALNAVMAHYTGRSRWDYADAQLAATCVFCVNVDQLSCKLRA